MSLKPSMSDEGFNPDQLSHWLPVCHGEACAIGWECLAPLMVLYVGAWPCPFRAGDQPSGAALACVRACEFGHLLEEEQ